MMSQSNDLKHLSSQIRPKKLLSDQQPQQQQTYVKDPEQECSRSKILSGIQILIALHYPQYHQLAFCSLWSKICENVPMNLTC